MYKLIVKDGVVVYDGSRNETLTPEGVIAFRFRDPNTTTANAFEVVVDYLPQFFACGKWGWDGEKLAPLPEYAAEVLAEARAAKMDEVNAAYEAAVAVYTGPYPVSEQRLFDKQELEAIAWQANNEAVTPFLDALAAGRQMEKSAVVDKILNKAAPYSAATGYFTGLRGRYKDQINAAETLDAVDAIVPDFTLPEELTPPAQDGAAVTETSRVFYHP